MVAYMDAEALAATLETGEVHFHSRSRDRLWRKGETLGPRPAPRVARRRLRRRRAPRDGRPGRPDVPPRHAVLLRRRRRSRGATGPGLRLARDAVGDDRLARGRAPGRLLHHDPARGRRRRDRPQGHRGSHRGAPGGQGRRHGRVIGHARRPSPARPRTCCTTPSCCSPNAISRPGTSSASCASATPADDPTDSVLAAADLATALADADVEPLPGDRLRDGGSGR